MRVLVTGATGLLGANVVRALLGAGHAVRAAVRASSRQLALTDLPVETSVLTLEEPESVAAAMAGCQAIVHAAAANWVGQSGRAWMERVNVQGTETVCRVALETGIRRMASASIGRHARYPLLEHPPTGCRSDLAHLRCPYIDTREPPRTSSSVTWRWTPRRDRQPNLYAGPRTPSYFRSNAPEIAKGWALPPAGGNSFLDERAAAIGSPALERGGVGGATSWEAELTYLDAWRRIAPIVGGRGPSVPPLPLAPGLGRAAGFLGAAQRSEPVVNPVSVAMGELPHYSAPLEPAPAELPESDFERAVSDAGAGSEHGYAPDNVSALRVVARRASGARFQRCAKSRRNSASPRGGTSGRSRSAGVHAARVVVDRARGLRDIADDARRHLHGSGRHDR